MNFKKFIAAGASAALLSLAACSDEPTQPNQNPIGPDNSQSSPTEVSSAESGNEPSENPSSSSSAVLVASSALSETDDPQMACSEIMYNAPDGSELEWVEVYIAGGSDMDNMQNYTLHLSGDVSFDFPAESLKKGEYVVVANNVELFNATYPTFAGRVFGPMSGKMVNEGGVVNVKVRGEGDVTCAFSSEPPWPSLADGKGRSLVYTGGIAAQSVSWCASATPKGNPGVGNDACIDVVNTVRINELKPSLMVNGAYENAWMELYNSGSVDVDVSGWSVFVKLRGDTLNIKSGVVPAGGYLVLDGVEAFDRELVVSKDGGEVYLYGLAEGQEASIWIPAGEGTSGIVDVADGSIAQGPLAEPTPGAKNSPLKLGSVYINEIHYHPNETGTLPFEFMEIVNSTNEPVALFDNAIARGWKIEGINFEFSSGASIPAQGMILLIPEALEDVQVSGWGPDLVRSSFKVPETVQIVTYSGKLSNRGETIALKQPFTKSGDGKVFYTWHDATLYSDAWAGLTEADGAGYSLQRNDVTTMGYGPSAWKAADPTPGL